MSQKNHKMTDGKLLQTDKKYVQLKLKQKEKIAEWMFQATRDYYTKNYTFPNSVISSNALACVFNCSRIFFDVSGMNGSKRLAPIVILSIKL